MINYTHKLSALLEKKQKLIDEETRLIQHCKFEIANLAEQFNLIGISPALLAGVFADVQHALKSKDKKLQEWETQGARFLKSRRQKLAAITTPSASKK